MLKAGATAAGQGRTLEWKQDVGTVHWTADGKVSWTRKVGTLDLGVVVTATATNLASLDTSELSPARAVTP